MRNLIIISLLLLIALGITLTRFKNVPHVHTKELIDTVQLGMQLFHDPILSLDYSISCASCHQPKNAFADTVAFSEGIGGRLTSRNTPSVLNMLFRASLFWDGRANTLEEQALFPIENPDEMGLPIDSAITRLQQSTTYKKWFQKVFGELPNRRNLALAIAAFERTLETGYAPQDLWIDGDENAISEEAKWGRTLFREKAMCFECHFTPDFTNDDFFNIGLFNGKDLNDSGRYLITKNPADIGKFKVPGLRNVALTAPYMHNGQFNTLEEVIEFYNNPDAFVPNAVNRDTTIIRPLGLTAQEKAALVAFLHTLTSPDAKK